jgi:mercuric ion transport protein
MKRYFSLSNLSILTALAGSLCCIMPVLAIVAGTSSFAANLSWLTPARPFFIGATVLILGFAWFQKLKPQPVDACGCAVEQKTPFMQTKSFLSLLTVVSIALLAFPNYAHLFTQKADNQLITQPNASLEKIEFQIEGMTCSGCEHHISTEINKLKGIAALSVSYEKGNAVVNFDKQQTTVNQILAAIDSTGYKAINYQFLSQ